MWYSFFFATAILMMPLTGFAQEVNTESSVDVEVKTNLGRSIKVNCAGLSGIKRVVCLRETKQKAAKTHVRGQKVRGRERESKAFESFEGGRGMRLKDVSSGKVKQSVRTSVPSIGEKVKKMTQYERRILKGKMNEEKIMDNKREQSRRAKVESLKKRIHRR